MLYVDNQIIHGVLFIGPLGALEEMHLLSEPIFVVPTDGIGIMTITSSLNGRLFLGGRDGSLFEIEYKVSFISISYSAFS